MSIFTSKIQNLEKRSHFWHQNNRLKQNKLTKNNRYPLKLNKNPIKINNKLITFLVESVDIAHVERNKPVKKKLMRERN